MKANYQRFYGMAVPEKVVETITEGLTDQQTEGLVEAHIGRNYSYFGAIDKTLSGFVILDDKGDNYTLNQSFKSRLRHYRQRAADAR